jgi:hypothetical protein
LRTESFAGSDRQKWVWADGKWDVPYGCSLLGISNRAGKAAWYLSTAGRIFSAIYGSVHLHTVEITTDMLVDQEYGNILSFSVILKRRFDHVRLCLYLIRPWTPDRESKTYWNQQSRSSSFADYRHVRYQLVTIPSPSPSPSALLPIRVGLYVPRLRSLLLGSCPLGYLFVPLYKCGMMYKG